MSITRSRLATAEGICSAVLFTNMAESREAGRFGGRASPRLQPEHSGRYTTSFRLVPKCDFSRAGAGAPIGGSSRAAIATSSLGVREGGSRCMIRVTTIRTELMMLKAIAALLHIHRQYTLLFLPGGGGGTIYQVFGHFPSGPRLHTAHANRFLREAQALVEPVLEREQVHEGAGRCLMNHGHRLLHHGGPDSPGLPFR